MIGFLFFLVSAACLLAWLIWRDARNAPEMTNPAPASKPEIWQPRRPYRTLL
jgi:hypothetical protein